jgi:hypothetical protein
MDYRQAIEEHTSQPEELEALYGRAVKEGQAGNFTEAIEGHFASQPGNLLLAAWHYRFAAAVSTAARWTANWAAAIPLAVINGFLLWLLSGQQWAIKLPGREYLLFMLLWAPISAVMVMAYLSLGNQSRAARSVALGVALASISAYVLLTYSMLSPVARQGSYLDLMLFHLPLMAWAAVGMSLMWLRRDADNRFAFLIKSLEVFILAGLFAIAGGIFVVITSGLFQALSIDLPEAVLRLLFAGGGGLIPVLAVAVLYNPQVDPVDQSFDEGLSKVISTLMRLLLPLTLLVLVIYLGFIPFNFGEPFRNRDVLIVYNAMLFAVMALLVGATPVHGAQLSKRHQVWLRRGLVVAALLATVISLYALSAIVYRTVQQSLTPNRLDILGWNIVNIAILVLLLFRQWRPHGGDWAHNARAAFSVGAVAYVVWGLVVILALPWLF